LECERAITLSGSFGMMNDEVPDTHGQFTAALFDRSNNPAAKVLYALGAVSFKEGKAECEKRL
jgi:hypothetical protein